MTLQRLLDDNFRLLLLMGVIAAYTGMFVRRIFGLDLTLLAALGIAITALTVFWLLFREEFLKKLG